MREPTADYGVDAIRLSIQDALGLARLPSEEEGEKFLRMLRLRAWKVVEAEWGVE